MHHLQQPYSTDLDKSKPFMSMSQDASVFAWVEQCNTVGLWQVETGMRIQDFSTGSAVRGLTISPDSSFVAVTGFDLPLLWRTDTQASTPVLLEALDEISSNFSPLLEFSHDSRILVAADFLSMRLWRTDTGRCIHVFHHQGVVSLVFGRSKPVMASCSGDKVRLWRLDVEGQDISDKNEHKFSDLSWLDLSADASVLASCDPRTDTIWLCSAETARRIGSIHSIYGIDDKARSLLGPVWRKKYAFSKHATLIATGDRDGNLHMSKVKDASSERVLKSKKARGPFAFSSDNWLIVLGECDKIRIWRRSTQRSGTWKKARAIHLGGKVHLLALAFSSNSQLLVGAGKEEFPPMSTISLWDVHSGEPV